MPEPASAIMKLTVVGCSGSCPSQAAAASCYLLQAGDTRILLDLGNGAHGPLQRYVDPAAVDAVLLSHLHPDHWLDLCSFYVYRTYHPDGPYPPIPIHGPRDIADRFAAAYGPSQQGLRDAFAFHEWGSGAVTVGSLTITTERVDHPVEAYGIRVEHDGRVLSYSGDTGPCAALANLAEGADVFLCEAAFQHGRDRATGVHLTGREAGEFASKAGVGRLVLTHIPPWNDERRTLAEASAEFDGPIDLARPGLVVDL